MMASVPANFMESAIVEAATYEDPEGNVYEVFVVRGLRDATSVLALSPVWQDRPTILIEEQLWRTPGRQLEFALWHESRHWHNRFRFGMTVRAGVRNLLLDLTTFSYLIQEAWYRLKHRGEPTPVRAATPAPPPEWFTSVRLLVKEWKDVTEEERR